MSKAEKLKECLERSKKEKFAIPAINTTNMETTQAIVEAAKELNAPVILQVSESAIKYAGFDYCEAILGEANKNPNIFVHLDHGSSLELVKKCIESPVFSSVMIDKSKLDFKENLEFSKLVKEYAGYKIVEAELGLVGGKEEDVVTETSIYTNPNEAKEFAEKSRVDILAIAVGTAHGVYKDEPKLNYELITQIKNLIGSTAIVLHGSSGLSDDQLKKAVEAGVSKVNLDTEFKQEYIKGFVEYLEKNPKDYDLRKIFGAAKELLKELIKKKIILLGADGKFI